MTSEVDLCNEAISHLSIDDQIQSFDDDSQTAQACRQWYAPTRDRLLKSAPWDFAFTSAALASDSSQVGPALGTGGTQPLPGWQYAYQYPNDCLQSISVVPPGGTRYFNSYWRNWWNSSYPQWFVPKWPFKVLQSRSRPGEKMIVCDLPPTQAVYLCYIQQVTDVDLFDDLFQEALGFAIAARIGRALRSNIQRLGEIEQQAKMLKLSALAQMMNQSQQDPAPDSPSVTVR